jgi:starvation-inducible DNA-binding protein
MERITVAVENGRNGHVGELLQDLLIDLVSLTLNANHARWHVIGPSLLPVRQQLVRFVTDLQAWADRVAERSITLGVPVDGRPSTIGRARVLKEFPAGLVADHQVLVEIADEMSDVVVRARAALEPLAAGDPVSQHLVIEALGGLERWMWTLQAQGMDRSGWNSEAPVGELRQLKPARV